MLIAAVSSALHLKHKKITHKYRKVKLLVSLLKELVSLNCQIARLSFETVAWGSPLTFILYSSIIMPQLCLNTNAYKHLIYTDYNFTALDFV